MRVSLGLNYFGGHKVHVENLTIHQIEGLVVASKHLSQTLRLFPEVIQTEMTINSDYLQGKTQGLKQKLCTNSLSQNLHLCIKYRRILPKQFTSNSLPLRLMLFISYPMQTINLVLSTEMIDWEKKQQ